MGSAPDLRADVAIERRRAGAVSSAEGFCTMSILQHCTTLTRDQSEALAMRALGFLASNQREFDRFLAQVGILPAEPTRQPVTLELLVAALDFVIASEAALLEFVRAVDLPPEVVYDARRRLNPVDPAGQPRVPPRLSARKEKSDTYRSAVGP
jgi:hypothetical protein